MLVRLLRRLRFLRRLGIGRIPDWFYWTRAKLRSPGRLTADSLPDIQPPFRVEVLRGATFHVGRNTKFRTGFTARVEQNAHFRAGDDVLFNSFCWVGATERIEIGNSVLFAPRCTIVDGDHKFDAPDLPIWRQGLASEPIVIGNDVWIAAGAVVMSSVGDGSVVGANAVVTNPIPAHSIAVGVPARVVKNRADA